MTSRDSPVSKIGSERGMVMVSAAYRTFNFIIKNNLLMILPRDDFPRWQDANGVFLLE
jgi:hypothetical protein